MQYLIILVHGTFANQAPWIRSDSDFCKKINITLGGNVSFESFNWSGKNSHSGRITASEELTVLLKKYSEQKDTEKIIIAHSHGGNVAMYALKNLNEKSQEFRLVTMATPYLNATERDYKFIINLGTYLIPFILCSALVLGTGLLFFYFTRKFKIEPAVAALIGCIYVYPFLLKKAKMIEKNIYKRVDAAFDKISFANGIWNKNILAIIDRNDEITKWFRFLLNVWDLVVKAQGAVIIGSMMIGIGTIVYGIFDLFSELLSNSINHREAGENIVMYAGMLGFVGLALLAAFLFIGLISFCIFTLLKSNMLMLGGEGLLQQLFIKIDPSPVPLQSKINYIQHNSSIKGKGLKHSIYNDDIAINLVTNWIINKNKGIQRVRTPQDFKEIAYDPEMRDNVMILLLARTDKHDAKQCLLKLNLVDTAELDDYILKIKEENKKEIEQIATARYPLLLEETIAFLCNIDEKILAVYIYGRIMKRGRILSSIYVRNIILKYRVDLSPERKRAEAATSKRYKLPKRILATLTLMFYAFVSLGVMWSDEISVFFSLIFVSYTLKTILSFKIMFLPVDEDYVSIAKKEFLIADIFTKSMIGECILYGLCYGFTPFGDYFKEMLYLIIPTGIIVGILYEKT